jgi:hypothetical protein
MGGAFSAHGGRDKCCRTLVGRPTGRDHSEDLGVDGKLNTE